MAFLLQCPDTVAKVQAEVDWDNDLLPHLIEWASSDETVVKFSSATIDSKIAMFTVMGPGRARIVASWVTADDVKCLTVGEVNVYPTGLSDKVYGVMDINIVE